MTFRTTLHYIGGGKKATYKPGTIIDKKPGANTYFNAKQAQGLYYFKLAAGGGWGSTGYYNNPGRGAGAAWEGYIFLRKLAPSKLSPGRRVTIPHSILMVLLQLLAKRVITTAAVVALSLIMQL